MPVATFSCPSDDCKERGKFRPASARGDRERRVEQVRTRSPWAGYMNAGLRVIDLADPYHLNEVGHYVPKTNMRGDDGAAYSGWHRWLAIDSRGLAYAGT